MVILSIPLIIFIPTIKASRNACDSSTLLQVSSITVSDVKIHLLFNYLIIIILSLSRHYLRRIQGKKGWKARGIASQPDLTSGSRFRGFELSVC